MTFKIDTSHSQVQFTVRHMMISKVRGTFEVYDGDFNLDENNPAASQFEVRVDTASINTRDAQRDAHLRSADFFDVEKYPHMIFRSQRVEVTGPETAKVYGELTIRDVTRPVTLDVEYNGAARSPWGSTSYGFNASATINRKDWNLAWNVALETGGVLVGEEVKIDIEVELVKQEASEAAAG